MKPAKPEPSASWNVRDQKKKVGKTVLVAHTAKRNDRGEGGHGSGGEPTTARPGHVAANDEGDAGRRQDGQGVLRQPQQLEQVSARQGDAQGGQARADEVQPYEPKSGGLTLFRIRHSKAKSAIQKGKCKTHEVCVSFQAATEIIQQFDREAELAKKALKLINEFEDIMLNPNWEKKETYERVDMMIATLHATLTNLKDTIE